MILFIGRIISPSNVKFAEKVVVFILPGDVKKKALTSTLSESAALRKAPLSKTRSVPAGKIALSRTRSVNPTITVTSASEVHSQARVSGHPKLGRTTTAPSWSFGSDDKPKMTVTSATPDAEKWKSYDDLLTAFRKKIELSEAQEKQKESLKAVTGFMGQHYESDTSLPAAVGAEGASLMPPQHWSHESLRHTHSDPPSMHYAESTLGGHLALAKTLSDEGAKSDEINRARMKVRNVVSGPAMGIQGQGQIRPRSPLSRQMSPHQMQAEGANLHRKLQRQLSLKGAEDPRLHQHQEKYSEGASQQYSHPPLQQSQSNPVKPLQNKPSFRFHGHDGPHNPYIRIQGSRAMAQPPVWNFGGPEPRLPPGWQDISPGGPRVMIGREKAPLMRHASLGGPQAHPLLQQVQQQQFQHAPLGRMSSAPGKYVNKSQDQDPSVDRLGIPRMTRQNSTSDPQIHAHLVDEQLQGGMPFESYRMGADLDQMSVDVGMRQGWRQPGSFEDMQSQMSPGPRQEMFFQRTGSDTISSNIPFGGPPPNSSQISMDQNQDRLTPPNLCLENSSTSQARIPFGSTHMNIVIDNPVFDPSVPPPSMPPHIHTPPRGSSPVRQDSSPASMSPAHHAMLQKQRHSPPPPSMQDPSSFTANFGGFGYGQHPITPANAPLSYMPGNSDFGSHEHLAVGSKRRVTPPQSAIDSQPLISNDTRSSIFYHLSGLFPEDKVRAAMEAHPNETDAKVLCAHILEMK